MIAVVITSILVAGTIVAGIDDAKAEYNRFVDKELNRIDQFRI